MVQRFPLAGESVLRAVLLNAGTTEHHLDAAIESAAEATAAVS